LLADVLAEVNQAGDIVVLGAQEALAAANEEGLELAVTKVM
jgi:hypothetical protein